MTLGSGRGPLAGTIVLDLTRVLAGPTASMILGDLGATVIKVEDPRGGDTTRSNLPMRDGESSYFVSVNRNKKSVCLDLKSEAGIQAILDLVSHIDVLIENFRPGVMERLQLSYERLSALNPLLVYCSISGFGQYGPLRGKISFDIVTQAMTGVMSINGDPDGPPTKLGLPMGDLAGGVLSVISIVTTLGQRERSGQGQYIDISLHDSLLYMLGYFGGLYFMTGESAGRFGSSHHNVVPYGAFPASDGYVVIAAFGQGFWSKLCNALDARHLSSDARFLSIAERYRNRVACDAVISAETRKHSVNELCALLDAGDVPNAPVLTIGEALEHPQTIARGMVQEVDHPTLGRMRTIGSPFKLSGWEGDENLKAAPLLGEDTKAILTDVLGYDQKAVDRVLEANELAGHGAHTK